MREEQTHVIVLHVTTKGTARRVSLVRTADDVVAHMVYSAVKEVLNNLLDATGGEAGLRLVWQMSREFGHDGELTL